MEEQVVRFAQPGLDLPAEETTAVQAGADLPAARAVEALMRAIAQEFVVAMDDFHDALSRDDEPAEPGLAMGAGHSS